MKSILRMFVIIFLLLFLVPEKSDTYTNPYIAGAGFSVCNLPSLIEYWPLTSDANGACNGVNLSEGGTPTYGSDGVTLDGSTDYLYKTTPAFAFGDANLTIIAIVIQNTDTVDIQAIASQYDSTNDDREYMFGSTDLVDGTLKTWIGIDSSGDCGDDREYENTTATITEDVQYMVAWRHDESANDTFYDVFNSACTKVINWEDLTFPSGADNCITGTEDFVIGAFEYGSVDGFWDGNIKRVMLFNDDGGSVLTDAELEEICENYM
jgi:hypothetical protein